MTKTSELALLFRSLKRRRWPGRCRRSPDGRARSTSGAMSALPRRCLQPRSPHASSTATSRASRPRAFRHARRSGSSTSASSARSRSRSSSASASSDFLRARENVVLLGRRGRAELPRYRDLDPPVSHWPARPGSRPRPSGWRGSTPSARASSRPSFAAMPLLVVDEVRLHPLYPVGGEPDALTRLGPLSRPAATPKKRPNASSPSSSASATPSRCRRPPPRRAQAYFLSGSPSPGPNRGEPLSEGARRDVVAYRPSR